MIHATQGNPYVGDDIAKHMHAPVQQHELALNQV